jgi:predicted nuclease of predicted toxin-antitoxin system
MRILLDANLSWRMASVLKQHFDDCFHVDSIGLTVSAKVILMKTGNQSRLYITNLLIQRKDEILAFSSSSEIGLLEIVSK